VFKLKIILITGNMGKLKEFNELGRKYGIEFTGIPGPKIEIQSEDLREVAAYSAAVALTVLRKPLMVEDAGLFIKSLDGFPGPYSSYIFKKIGYEGILKLMKGVKDRRAFFKSVIAFADPQIGIKIFEGFVHGTIAERARGTLGFGFDPIFIPEGYSRTFAEMQVHEKNEISHRGKAFKNFANWLNNSFKS
jgi:XTP/dITP diphosphohydrolase